MNYTTFDTYQTASKLQTQALETMNALELLADSGVRKAESLLELAWNRYNRRTYQVNRAANAHWGDL